MTTVIIEESTPQAKKFVVYIRTLPFAKIKKVKDNGHTIKQSERRKHFSTKDRIANFGEAMEDGQLSETNWGKPQGKEIW